MKKKFITLEKAIAVHKQIQQAKFPSYLKHQILRSSLSIALNLSEGSYRQSNKDKLRFYNIAFASLRETQTALECNIKKYPKIEAELDQLGALLYNLSRSVST